MTGLEAKQQGLQLVCQHNAHFIEEMRLEAEKIARRQGQVSIDELRAVAARRGLRPLHRNAWGGIFMGSKWRRVGEKHSAIPSNRHRRINLWSLA